MRPILVAVGALALLAGCGSRTAGTGPVVRVTDAWARASAGAAAAGAVYMTLESPGGDRLVGVSVSPSVAGVAQIHETVRTSGVIGAGELRMQRARGMDLPAGTRVTFAPGQRHVMLLELVHPLAAGDTIALGLAFARAAPETLRIPVRDE